MNETDTIQVTDRTLLNDEQRLFQCFCRRYDTDTVFEQINDEIEHFNECVEHSVHELLVTKTVNIRFSKDWYDSELAEMKNVRNVAQIRADS